MATLDPSKIQPIPIQKTILAVNNFLVNTTIFLNDFSNSCETKFAKVSSRITDLETTLMIFEAKLNSLPMNSGNEKISLQTSETTQDIEKGQALSHTNDQSFYQHEAAPRPPPPPPPPPPLNPPSSTNGFSDVNRSTSETIIEISGQCSGVKVKDHPDYTAFFKMMKVGVPLAVLTAKMESAGLDPSYLHTPEKEIE